MDVLEYLVSYGVRGDFGRFRAARPLALGRGDRAVVRTRRGLEVGEVLRPAAPSHAAFLPNTSVGQLVRPVTADDEAACVRGTACALRLTERANESARSLD